MHEARTARAMCAAGHVHMHPPRPARGEAWPDGLRAQCIGSTPVLHARLEPCCHHRMRPRAFMGAVPLALCLGERRHTCRHLLCREKVWLPAWRALALALPAAGEQDHPWRSVWQDGNLSPGPKPVWRPGAAREGSGWAGLGGEGSPLAVPGGSGHIPAR